LVRSIVRTKDNDDDDEGPCQEQLYNGSSINDNNSLLEAAGYDQTRLTDVDADAAYALQLQQEEYAKESFIPNRHPYFPFQVEPDNEIPAVIPPPFSGPNNPQFMNDEQYAAYLQEEENQNRQRYRPPPPLFFPIRQRSNPTSTQTSETDEHENEPMSPFRIAQPQSSNNEDDTDEDSPYMNIPHQFLQLLANQGRPLPEDFPLIFPGFRRRDYRRTGNLQDTEEDFGPEDYEVIQILYIKFLFLFFSSDYFNLMIQYIRKN
jgi:hypothetical protein